MSGAIPPLPSTPSWRGAQLKEAQVQMFTCHGLVGYLTFIVNCKIFYLLKNTRKRGYFSE
jgi:hypothetical protein